MKCHFVKDKIAGKVLIPGCWGTVHSNDIEDCCCITKKQDANINRILKLEAEILILKTALKRK